MEDGLLAGRMLAPLTQIRAATTVTMDGKLSHRFRLEGPRDEFRDLADSFDVMLERLEAHVAEQRRFAANASHELRTPLAISQTLLEVARDGPDLDVNHLIDRLHAVNVRAIDLTQALLMLSRADQRSFTDGGEAPAVGSRALLLQLTINFLHNAISHNLADGGTVWVRTEAGDGSVELVVENTGEILPPELVSMLAEPFQCGTERVRSDQAGVGLGLTTVRSIVQAYGGTLTMTARPDGGLRVSAVLSSGEVAPRDP